MQKMDRYAQYSALILTLLMLSFTLLAHWLACIWFIIADKEIEVHRHENWDLGKLKFMFDVILYEPIIVSKSQVQIHLEKKTGKST